MRRHPLFAVLFTVTLFLVGLFTLNAQFSADDTFLPAALSEFVHILGLGVMAVIAILGGLSILNAYRNIATQAPPQRMENESFIQFQIRLIKALFDTVFEEVLKHKSFTQCDELDSPDYRKPWVVHMAMVWGFIIMSMATVSAMLFPTHGEAVPLWHISRLLGTVGGLVFLYGVMGAIVNRLQKRFYSSYKSHPSDWLFLGLLLAAVLSGFMVEILIYLPNKPGWYQWVLFSHIAVSMELLLLLPFTKFAHAIYRIFALWLHRANVEATEAST